jgi:hypothetical protein
LPPACPPKSGRFRDIKSLRFFLQDLNQVHGFTPDNRPWFVMEKRTVVFSPLF